MTKSRVLIGHEGDFDSERLSDVDVWGRWELGIRMPGILNGIVSG